MTADHAALRDRITAAERAWQDALRLAAQPAPDMATFHERQTDARIKSARHSALIEAGFRLEVGPLGEDE